MTLVDTHCHIHSAGYDLNPDEVIAAAKKDGVKHLICVGTDAADSRLAAEFVAGRPDCYASAGLHPHDSKLGEEELKALEKLADSPKVVAIGECGLDYFYNHSARDDQIETLEFQIELAIKSNLPIIFHVREAFEDFWPIYDNYQNLRGVIHSFSATQADLEEILKRGLYIGLNGIMTFTKRADQLQAARAVPLERLLLETDSPFLTPAPFRGKINEPKYVMRVAEFLADLRGEDLENLAEATTQNAINLFGINK